MKLHNKLMVKWMVEGGRKACFASFGLHKTVTQLEAIRCTLLNTGGRGLIICPLGVRQEFVRASFLDKQYSGKANHQSVNQPAGVIMANDKHSLITSFIDRQFTGGGQNSSIEKPAGSITSVPKLNLVQAEMNFVDTSQYKNVPTSTKEPLPYHYDFITNVVPKYVKEKLNR